MKQESYWPFDDNESERRFWRLMRDLKESSDGGVAFFGAGASATAGFPMWKEFHKMFLAHFGAELSPSDVNPYRDMLTDFDYHTSRDPVKSLAFVKETFAASAFEIPKLVKLALATPPLRYFYTTNFDEILFDAASGEDEKVAAYPDYMPMDARFVYLHGRASTANSVHKGLVLGSAGYDRAYDDSMGGFARAKLQMLVPYPVIFIGFSMSDQSVARSLEEITRAARYRHVDPVDGAPEEAISSLNWYILLKAPAQTEPGREERKRERELRLSGLGVQVIWYRDGGASGPHRGGLDVMRRIQRESRGLTVAERDSGFSESLLEAEEIASVASPTRNQVRRAQAVLEGHPRVAAAFMEHVDGLEWFRSLRDVNALGPRRSFETKTGERRAPYWHSVGLLRRVASVAPSEVKDFLLTLEIDNWVAVRQGFEILEALDESSGVALGERFADWTVRAMAIDPHLLFGVSRTAQRLDADGKCAAAIELVQAILIRISQANPILSAVGATRVSEILAPILARSRSGHETLKHALRASLERECGSPDQDNVRLLRPAIEIHRMNREERSVLGLLIDLMRDTLLATDQVEWRSGTVESLLESPWPTERRIGVAHCSLMRTDLFRHEASLITFENLSNPHLFHELAKLIVDEVDDLSERANQVLRDFAKSLWLASSEAKEHEYEYELWAAVLPSGFLVEAPEEKEEDDDEPERRLFRDFYVGAAFSPTAPVDSASFAKLAEELTADELIALVRDPASAGVRVTWRHSKEAMWTMLADYVKEHDVLHPLLKIDLHDLGGNGTWRAIEAMPEVAGEDPERWSRVFDWADHTASKATADELWSIGLLLQSSSQSVPFGLRERLTTLAIRVIENSKRDRVSESKFIGDSLLGAYLNRPAGKAVQSLFEVLRREIADTEAGSGVRARIPGWFKQTVLSPMTKEPMALGIDSWIGLGRFYSLMCERDPDAVAFVAQNLESQTSKFSVAAVAFWAGHLWAPLISSDALERLRGAYRSSACILQREEMLEDDLRDRFFQHCVIAVLRDIPGYDDLLLTTLSADFTPETRGSIVFALGSGVHEAAHQNDTPFKVRSTNWFLRYWTEHVHRLGGQDGPQLARYLRWLSDIDLPPNRIADLVEESLTQVDDSFEVGELFEYLSRYVEDDPIVVLGLLERCVEWYRLHGDFWLDAKNVRALLDRIAPLTLNESTLSVVTDGFAELGAISTDDVRRYLSGK